MICAWKELLGILPSWISREVDKFNQDHPQEIRLRMEASPEIVMSTGSADIEGKIHRDDLNFCINAASRYSPWAAASIHEGFLTAPGGHRIGVCGEGVIKENRIQGIRNVTSLCIRVARDYPGICGYAADLTGSILIIGAPGCGKTTLLRDLLRKTSESEYVAVADERGELFPMDFTRGAKMDVMVGCRKNEAVTMLLRTMGPQCIGMDEITSKEDCQALLHAGWCGVRLMATAHAGSVRDLVSRPLYRPILESRLFDHILVMDRQKNWREERVIL